MADRIFGFIGATWIVLLVVGIPAWITHVAWSLRLLMSDATAPVGKYVLAGIGAFMPPIGAVHGVLLWFGA